MRHSSYIFTITIYVVLLTFIVFLGCARIGSPAGGPMDEDPPKIKKSTPTNYTTRFDGKTIEIQFDEYIRLDDINQKLIVSPPLDTRPQVRTKGKSVLVSFEDTLLENTTYTFNFNDAIVDNNEGNPLENFQFVFSTGNALDSLIFSGQVIDAFNKEIPRNVIVCLYEDLSDSVIFKKQPLFLTKINDKGQFLLRNLKPGTFQLFALQDENVNYMYDPPEMVAFSDTLIRLDPAYSNYLTVDDTSSSIKTDGILLYQFSEKLSEQYLKTSDRTRKEYFQLIFNIPPVSEPGIQVLDYESEAWYLKESFIVGDTLGYWIKDTTLINREVLDVVVDYQIQNNNDGPVFETDTLRLRFTEPRRSRRRTNIESNEQKGNLEITFFAGSGFQLDLGKNLLIETKTPIHSIDTQKIQLLSTIDSIQTNEPFKILPGSGHIRKRILKTDWREGAKYELKLFPGAVNDLYDQTNDTVKFSFGVRELDFYGNIIVVLESIDKSLIIQLLDEKEQVLKTEFADSDTTIQFRLLHPRTYKIKAIWDKNMNGKWDTGNLLEHIQPERVDYYIELIKLRSNWDFEKNWSPQFNE